MTSWRLWQRLCKLPRMNWTQAIGLFAGICTSSSLLPQLVKTIKEKKAEEISKLMLFVLLIGVAGWVVYGFLRDDMPIIITNSFSLLLNIFLIILRFKYSRKGK
jgi:MtN3 and saliva related transmembrane protein